MKMVASLLFVLPLAAEFRSIEIGVSGLDCVSCARSVGSVIRRIRGVESAQFLAEDALAVVQLRPGNKIPLEEIRDALKRVGYTPQDAKVGVFGSAVPDGDKWLFRVTGLQRTYLLEFPAERGPADQAISRRIRDRAGEPLFVEGLISASSERDTPEVLKVRAVRESE